MIVRRNLTALAALLVLLIGAGCGDRDGALLPAETDEPLYVQGVQLKKQARNGEALTAFLKVIDRRGERGAAESHFEAGEIFLNHSKDPGEAYHHFRKYLELQPNSKQADLVRGRVETARREFWKQVAGRPLDDNSVRLQIDEEVSKLRRDNLELRAELNALRDSGAMPVNRSRAIALPLDTPLTPSVTVPTASIADSPIRPAPAPVRSAPAQASMQMTPAPSNARTTTASNPTPTAAAKQAPRATTPTAGTHAMKRGETLFGVAKQYNVKVADLMAANAIRDPSQVPVGAVLKIPGGATKR